MVFVKWTTFEKQKTLRYAMHQAFQHPDVVIALPISTKMSSFEEQIHLALLFDSEAEYLRLGFLNPYYVTRSISTRISVLLAGQMYRSHRIRQARLTTGKMVARPANTKKLLCYYFEPTMIFPTSPFFTLSLTIDDMDCFPFYANLLKTCFETYLSYSPNRSLDFSFTDQDLIDFVNPFESLNQPSLFL